MIINPTQQSKDAIKWRNLSCAERLYTVFCIAASFTAIGLAFYASMVSYEEPIS